MLNSTFLYKVNGDLFVLGLNDNRSVYINKPTLLMNDINIVFICCGNYHLSLRCLFSDLFAFGSNTHGQLGLGDNTN